MNSARPAFNFGSFFQRLIFVGLCFLLPLQLGLLWFSTFKQPVRLPDFMAAFVSSQISKEGINLQTRSLWIQPDLDIAADDVSLEFSGISGEMITAKHFEVGISFLGLISGRTMPHRLSIQGGQVWCPAALSQFGQKTLLIAEIDGDFHREGVEIAGEDLAGGSGANGDQTEGLLRRAGRSGGGGGPARGSGTVGHPQRGGAGCGAGSGLAGL